MNKPSAIDGRYIVVLDKEASAGTASAARVDVRALGAKVLHRYDDVLEGFSARLSQRALEALRSNPNVAYIEADSRVTVSDTQSPATWGLDRIDQRNRPLSNSYTYNATGTGVTAYIIDTGIRLSHTQFGGRAVSGYDAVDGGSADDCNGHGTHVAGTVGGSTHGVAKNVRLVAVRVLNCQGSGTNSGVIAGVDWVTGNHAAGQPAVANMSLGGGANTALDNAVNSSINDGVSYAVAAGNDGANACSYSPARVGAAITVGSTTSSDARSSFSNYGSCLDVFAPGSSITSTWRTSNTATNTISGTSMASPHVAGVAALYLQGSPTASPQPFAMRSSTRRLPASCPVSARGRRTCCSTRCSARRHLLHHHLRAAARSPSRITGRSREPETTAPIPEARTSTRVGPVHTAAACAVRLVPTSTSTSTSGTASTGRSSLAARPPRPRRMSPTTGPPATTCGRFPSYSGSGSYSFGMTRP